MPIDAADNALTTVTKVKLLLKGHGRTDAENDDFIQYLINGYSSAIHRYTSRQFKPAETGTQKSFRYEGSGFLSLAPYEARSVSSVVLDTDLPDASWRTLAAGSTSEESEYRLEPRHGTEQGTYLWLALPELGMFSPLYSEPTPSRRARGHEITVTGDWGMTAVPADVDLATAIACANAYRNPERFASRSLGPLGFTQEAELALAAGAEGGMALPRDVRSLLSPYRRRAYA